MANLSFITSLDLRGDIEYHLYRCLLPFLLSLFAALSPGHISSTLSGSPLNSSRGLTPRLFQLDICIYVWTQLPSLFVPHQAVLGRPL